MTALIRNLVSAAAVLLLAGCVVWTRQPLSDTAAATIDEALLGAWQNSDVEGDHVELDITRAGEHLVLIALTTVKPDGGRNIAQYKAQTTVAGERRYLSVMDMRPGRREIGFMILRYQATPGGLAIALIDEDEVKRAIRDGEIEGMVDASSEFSDATIEATPGKLLAFLATHDAALFPKSVAFTPREQAPAATAP